MRWIPYVVAVGTTTPWLAQVAMGSHPDAIATAVMTGFAILAAAFMLGWACEVAEMDVPPALAVSVLALVAVLPEYAVDATFAWKAAHDPEQAAYAIANMTGGNRLLLGIGWTVLVGLAFLRFKSREIVLPADMGTEISVLIVATLYAIVPVTRGSLTLVDTAVYLVLYVSYLIAASRGEEHEGEVVGPAIAMAELPTMWRRAAVLLCLFFAGAVIFVSAEPFAESLVHTGKELGVDEFFLVQWVAPLASESPEFVVAILMVLRGNSEQGLRTLVSSKVNQWTLLVGTLAAVYSISSGHAAALPIDNRQREEILLTAAQSVFAIAAIADLRFALWQGAVLTGLFLLQFALPTAHFEFGLAYIACSIGILAFDKASRDGVLSSFRTFFRMLRGQKASRH
ncbi:MAG: sodium:calcium antiporter [Deltaproteobacteria bacterium]|nr:sodium:calcium antiporter [Deltaproteobacteria bacterium]MBM4391104.1 sodium:calcium antiporter [Deltaproteobacteria bacterium]